MSESLEQRTLRIAKDVLGNEEVEENADVIIEFARRLMTEQQGPSLQERTAQLVAHRMCCGSEHNPEQGKLHGYCVVCGVPWPCEYAGKPVAEQQEPVVWRYHIADDGLDDCTASKAVMSTWPDKSKIIAYYASPPQATPSEFVLTRNEKNEVVALTRQDDEGRVVEVLWERSSEQDALDAKRYRIARMHIAPRFLANSMCVQCPDMALDEDIPSRIDAMCDAALQEGKQP
ncbi:MAG: hypothetical protein NUV75_02055 [Gallionella sp.]|nr:hypothetical protein [Gallionella sp.]